MDVLISALVIYAILGLLASGITVGLVRSKHNAAPEPPLDLKMFMWVGWPIMCPVILMCFFHDKLKFLDPVGFVASLVVKLLGKKQA